VEKDSGKGESSLEEDPSFRKEGLAKILGNGPGLRRSASAGQEAAEFHLPEHLKGKI